MKQVTYEAGANFPSFYSIKQLGVFLLSSGWDASPLRVTPALHLPFPICIPWWREALWLGKDGKPQKAVETFAAYSLWLKSIRQRHVPC